MKHLEPIAAGRNLTNTGNVLLRDALGDEIGAVYCDAWERGHVRTKSEAKAIADRMAECTNALAGVEEPRHAIPAAIHSMRAAANILREYSPGSIAIYDLERQADTLEGLEPLLRAGYPRSVAESQMASRRNPPRLKKNA